VSKVMLCVVHCPGLEIEADSVTIRQKERKIQLKANRFIIQHEKLDFSDRNLLGQMLACCNDRGGG